MILSSDRRCGETRNALRTLLWKSCGKYPLERPRRRWGDNIKMNIREIGCETRR
jgi:hypothetical protein